MGIPLGLWVLHKKLKPKHLCEQNVIHVYYHTVIRGLIHNVQN